MFIDDVSFDCLLKIITYLSPLDTFNLLITNKDLYSLLNDDCFIQTIVSKYNALGYNFVWDLNSVDNICNAVTCFLDVNDKLMFTKIIGEFKRMFDGEKRICIDSEPLIKSICRCVSIHDVSTIEHILDNIDVSESLKYDGHCCFAEIDRVKHFPLWRNVLLILTDPYFCCSCYNLRDILCHMGVYFPHLLYKIPYIGKLKTKLLFTHCQLMDILAHTLVTNNYHVLYYVIENSSFCNQSSILPRDIPLFRKLLLNHKESDVFVQMLKLYDSHCKDKYKIIECLLESDNIKLIGRVINECFEDWDESIKVFRECPIPKFKKIVKYVNNKKLLKIVDYENLETIDFIILDKTDRRSRIRKLLIDYMCTLNICHVDAQTTYNKKLNKVDTVIKELIKHNISVRFIEEDVDLIISVTVKCNTLEGIDLLMEILPELFEYTGENINMVINGMLLKIIGSYCTSDIQLILFEFIIQFAYINGIKVSDNVINKSIERLEQMDCIRFQKFVYLIYLYGLNIHIDPQKPHKNIPKTVLRKLAKINQFVLYFDIPVKTNHDSWSQDLPDNNEETLTKKKERIRERNRRRKKEKRKLRRDNGTYKNRILHS